MLGKSKQKVSKEPSQEGHREESHPEQMELGHSLQRWRARGPCALFTAIFPAAQSRRRGKVGNGTLISAQGLEQLLGPNTGLSPPRPATTGPLGHLPSLAHRPHASFRACHVACAADCIFSHRPIPGNPPPPATNAGGNASLSLYWTATSLPHRAGQPARQ